MRSLVFHRLHLRGHFRTFRRNLTDAMLQAFITRAGGEVVVLPD